MIFFNKERRKTCNDLIYEAVRGTGSFCSQMRTVLLRSQNHSKPSKLANNHLVRWLNTFRSHKSKSQPRYQGICSEKPARALGNVKTRWDGEGRRGSCGWGRRRVHGAPLGAWGELGHPAEPPPVPIPWVAPRVAAPSLGACS